MRNKRTIPLSLMSLAFAALVLFLNHSLTQAVVGNPEDHSLIPIASPRLVVELTTPPLAAAYKNMAGVASSDGTLDTNSAAGVAYIAQLQAEQAAFISALQTALPNVAVASFV